MSIVFSKNKEKRSRSSASETANSFVKNVTSRVSGLIPASIAKWFSSPSSSNANGSVAAGEGSDSSTEDDTPESPITTQPPAKRMRYNMPESDFNQYAPQPALAGHMGSPEIQSSHLLYNTIQSPPGQHTFQHETNYISTPYMLPAAEISTIEVVQADRYDRDLTYQSPHIVSATSHPVTVKRKSIFETAASAPKEQKKSCAKEEATKTDRQPTFKPVFFGSPFYPGRTMYGGASYAPYINHSNIKERKMAYVRESPQSRDTVNMSYSARRVMDLLENLSSPVMEAKRIPVIRKPEHSINMESVPGRASTSQGYSYKTQELHIPSLASILQWKQQSRLMDTTRAARQIIASHSSTLSGFQPYVTETAKKLDSGKQTVKECTTKLKTRLTRPHRGEDQFDLPEPVQLPTAVLQIDTNNLPKFSITPPAASKPSISPEEAKKSAFTGSLLTTSTTVAKTTITETPVRGNIFKFAHPVQLSQETPPPKSSTTAQPSKYTFGAPKRSEEIPKPLEEKKDSQYVPFSHNAKKPESTAVKSTAKASQEWTCQDCLIENKAGVEKCVCCGAKPLSDASAPEPAKCSECNMANSMPGAAKCINCEKASIQGMNSIPLPIPQPADPSKWKCQDCWVSNEAQDEKCPCCGSRNPTLFVAPAPLPTQEDWKCQDCWILNKGRVDKCAACGGAKPAAPSPAQEDWKCDDCWISNKSWVDKCAACGKAKPPAPSPLPSYNSPFAKPPDEKLAEIARAQKAKWECSGCLVRNDTNKTECMCCGMEREGVSKEIPSKRFNFPKESNVNFKFGIDPREQEAKIAKKVESVFKMEPTRVLKEPETNNNNVTFTFTTPNKQSAGKLDNLKSMDASKMSFTFGIPQPAAVNKAAATSPACVAPSAVSTEEKPQEVPKIDFNALAQKQLPSGFFGNQPPTSEVPLKPFTSFASMPTNTTKEAPMKSSPFESAQKSNVEVQVFVANTSPSVFAPSSSAVPSSFPSVAPPQSAPGSSTPIFQSIAPANPSAAPRVDVFGGRTTTPAAPAAPLFNFGSNVQNSAPAPDKAKFNFTFGNTNNAASTSASVSTSASPFGSGFNTAFGSTVNNSAPNDFAMPAPAPQPSTLLGVDGSSLGNTMQQFGAPAQDQLWPVNTTPPVFGGANDSRQNTAPFTFGASNNPFDASASTSASQPGPSLFGNQQTAQQNPFGMPTQDGSQSGLFSSTQPTPAPMFGAPPVVGLFGASAPPPGFGGPVVPAFEAPVQTPAFNFGMAQASTVFGFGAQAQQPQQPQLQQQQPQPQQGVYNFGGGNSMGGMNQGMGGGMMNQPMGASMSGVQFNMGSAPNTRRVRKAVRRNPPR